MSKSKYILVICQYFYPEQFRINDICTEWVKCGYKVTVVTGIPNYPQGKFFKGYGLTKKRKEEWNGISIIRIPLIARGHTSVGMVLNYFSFMLSGKRWVKKTNLKADLVFNFETSPMTQSMIPVWYKKKFNVPYLIYVQDLWPENVEIVTGISHPLIVNPINKMVDVIYQSADEIFATSPSFVSAICNRKEPVDENKVHYWPQYAEDFYKPVERLVAFEKCGYLNLKDDGTFKIAFTGNVGYAQGLNILPDVAHLLRDVSVKFIIVGDGRFLAKLKEQVCEKEVADKFVFVGRQPGELIPAILGCCDAAYISFMNNSLFEKTIPAKLQSYMACAMPIIASAGGETKRIVEEAECGICSAIGDVNDLGTKIKELMSSDLKKMSTNSRDYCENNFDKNRLIDYMNGVIDDIHIH